MSGRGRGNLSRWLLGSVATKVVRSSQIPVMLVGGKVPALRPNQKKKIERILVPVDRSENAEAAYKRACEYAAQWDAVIYLYQGISDVDFSKQLSMTSNEADLCRAKIYLEGLAERHPDIRIFTEVQSTYGESGILSTAEEKRVDLIVMGSRGKSALERRLLGSETESALRHAKCPVVVVP